MSGYLAISLHAHLPFVRHPDHDKFLEESWLFEAITETYLPLLDVMHRLANEGVQFRLSMSLTPTTSLASAASAWAGRPLTVLEKVYDSEYSTAWGNRGIANLRSEPKNGIP